MKKTLNRLQRRYLMYCYLLWRQRRYLFACHVHGCVCIPKLGAENSWSLCQKVMVKQQHMIEGLTVGGRRRFTTWLFNSHVAENSSSFCLELNHNKRQIYHTKRTRNDRFHIKSRWPNMQSNLARVSKSKCFPRSFQIFLYCCKAPGESHLCSW